MPRITLLRLEVKPQDLWVGVFWKHVYCSMDAGEKVLATDIWLCVLPCLPIRVTLMWPVVFECGTVTEHEVHVFEETKRCKDNQITRLTAEVERLKTSLRDILCRIHRDGGQYIEEHGMAKAIADADLAVSNLHANLEVERLREFAKAHEKWEASLLMDNRVWENCAEFPTLNADLWNAALEVQQLRNHALQPTK